LTTPFTPIDTDRRFGGLSRLYGVTGAQQIRQSHIVVVGVGGVGSWAVECLARSGVGALTLIDMDHVSESNVNRQLHALSTTLGQSKVKAMQERIWLIHPDCQVTTLEEFITPENIPVLLNIRCDALIDACDQLSAKVALANWAMHNQVRMVTVGAAGGKHMAHWVEMADLAHTSHDPLLSQVRQQLRKYHSAPQASHAFGIQAVYSKETVKRPVGQSTPSSSNDLNCHGFGSVVSVTATFGNCAAGWVLNQLAA